MGYLKIAKQVEARWVREGDRESVSGPAPIDGRGSPAFEAQCVSPEAQALDLSPEAKEILLPSCWTCRGRFWWTSIYGKTICLTCHPPASPDLVVDFFGPSVSGR